MGMFDDLIPPGSKAPSGGGGMFDDLIPKAPGEDVTAGMALRGVPVLGAYVPQAEAAIRAAAQPLTGVGQPGATYAERYAANLPQRQADYARAEAESPITSEALKFGGGAAALAPLGATALGARALGATGGMASRLGLGAASGAGLAAADAAARGQDPGTAAMIGGGFGAAAPLVGSAASRLITPFQNLRGGAARAAAVANLEGEGIGLTAGQRTGSTPLQYLEQHLGDVTGAGSRAIEQGKEQATSAMLRRAGENAPRATPEVVDDMFKRIGTQFDNLAANNTLHPDAAMGPQLRTAVSNYDSIVSPPNRAPAIRDFEQEIAQALGANNGTIPGNTYQSLRSRIEATASRAPYEVANTLRDMKGALDSAMERHLQRIGSSDLGAWQQARAQYRNALVIQQAITGPGSDARLGLVSPSALTTAVKSIQGRSALGRGRGDMAQLANSMEAIMKPLPQSGTAPRMYMGSILPSLGVMGTGLATGNFPLALGGAGALAGPPLAGAALMSRPVQRYLGNQALRTAATARQAGTIGTQAAGTVLPGMAEGGRPDGPTLVGENGPEVFVPDRPGTIVPDPYEAVAARTRRRYPTRAPDPTSMAASMGGAADWRQMLQGQAGGMLTLPRRATQAAGDLQRTGQYDPGPAIETSLLSMGMPMLAGGMMPGLAAAGMYYPKLYGAAQRNAIQQGMRAGTDPQTVR